MRVYLVDLFDIIWLLMNIWISSSGSFSLYLTTTTTRETGQSLLHHGVIEDVHELPPFQRAAAILQSRPWRRKRSRCLGSYCYIAGRSETGNQTDMSTVMNVKPLCHLVFIRPNDQRTLPHPWLRVCFFKEAPDALQLLSQLPLQTPLLDTATFFQDVPLKSPRGVYAR